MIGGFYLRRALLVPLAFLLLLTFGCGRRRTVAVAPPPPTTNPIPAPVPTPAPIVGPILDNTRSPADARPDNIPPTPARREIVILFNNSPSYLEVVEQLRKSLPLAYRMTLIDVDAENSPTAVQSLRNKTGLVAVAIGLSAARVARDQLTAPIIFAQVFNYQELLVGGRSIRGVTALPPLDLQIQDWKKIDPKLQRIGLIVSQHHTDVISQAERAAKAAAVTLKPEISDSDRATLYLFKRLAPQIDGLWLVPDDRILSPNVLRELLSYAVSHGVHVCVFSDSLLQWGALMSASPTPADIARGLRRLLENMASDRANALPPLTPLSELVVRVNLQVAGRLGLTLPLRESWIVRSTPGTQ